MLVVLVSFSELALPQFSVQQLHVSNNDTNVQLITELQLIFTEPLQQAVDHGVTLQIVTEFGLPQENWYGLNFVLLKEIRYYLSRNALSGRYVVFQQDRNETRTFPSQIEALRHISIPPIVLIPTVDLDGAENLAVRTFVDTYKLPSPLRLQAFFSRRWSLDTDWTLWPIQL
jgi:hypothetical protein